MLKDVVKRVEQRLGAVKLSAAAASKEAGLSVDAIRNLKRAAQGSSRKGVSTRTLQALAPVLQTSVDWLLSESGPESRLPEDAPGRPTVPVKGYVATGAQAHFLPLDDDDLDRVEAPQGSTRDTVALEIRGTSLGELFDRFLVFFDDIRSPVTADMIGKTCVVGLSDGRILVRKLKRASEGRYDLVSDTQEPIRAVSVEWAARVKTTTQR